MVDSKDPIQVAFTEDETMRAGLYSTASADVVDSGQYDALYLGGGHGTMWDFPDSEGLQKLFAEVIHQEKAEEQYEAEALRAKKDAEKAAAAGTED